MVHVQVLLATRHVQGPRLCMKIFLLLNIKMPTIVGSLTFMSMKNSILGLSEHGKCLIS